MDLSDDEAYVVLAAKVLRIQPATFDALLFTFFAFAVVAAGARTGLRIYRFRRIEIDDIFLICSTIFLAGGVAVAYVNRDLCYLQLSVSLGLAEPPADFNDRMATFQLLDDIGGILTWLAIFAVKLAFLLFFKRLVTRVRYLETWWWVVLVTVVLGGITNCSLGFMICAHFGPDAVRICTVAGMTHREGIYLDVSTVIDIVTDLLIISIPIALLWRVKIDLRRKLALGTVCSLSAVMVVLACVRVGGAPVQSPVSPEIPPATDSLWLFVFQNIEAAVAIIMVSITAFRSMLGQKGSSRKTTTRKITDLEAKSVPLAVDPSLGSEDARQRERNESVWPAPAGVKDSISKPMPMPLAKDPQGPRVSRREYGSLDSASETSSSDIRMSRIELRD